LVSLFPCHPSPQAEDLLFAFLFLVVIPEGDLLLPLLLPVFQQA
jgi:hypothetical protein